MTTMTKADVAQAKFSKMIADGKARVSAGLESIHREFQMRHDFIARPKVIDVDFEKIGEKDGTPLYGAMRLVVEHEGKAAERFALTSYARNQILAMADIPTRFADTLEGHGLRDLISLNVRRLLAETAEDGLLVREVSGTAKAILSPSYKRMDSSPMFEAFVRESLKGGLVPHSGEVTDTRAFVSFLRPEIVEILPGEHVVFGIEAKNSDYGRGAFDLAVTIWRLLCSNGAIGTSMLRKIHLGRRFDAEGDTSNVIKLSAKTLDLDSKALASAVQDTVKALPAHAEAQVAVVRKAAEKEVNVAEVVAKLSKAGLRKATAEKVKMMFEEKSIGVESLPQQQNAWRLSNVLSLLANSEAGDAAHDLREMAHDVIAA